MQVRPLTPEALVDELADRLARLTTDHPLRVAVDGAPAGEPWSLADALVDPLRLRGRPVQRVSADTFLRPASVRLERGHHDPDAYYTDWLDADAINREVLAPLAAGGTRRVLPALWDAERDRAYRARYRQLPSDAILLLDGALLLGRGLAVDLWIHLALSPAALARRTETAKHWTLPAFERYTAEVSPESAADIVVRADHPERPALAIRDA